MESIDFIGERPNIYIKNAKYFKTTLGGILCLLMVVCTFLVSFYFGREVWEKKNPIVNSAEVFLTVPIELPLDKVDFEFFFGVSTELGYLTDPSIIDVRPQIFSYSTEMGGFFTIPFNVTVCKPEIFLEENRAMAEQLNIMDTFFCVPASQIKGLGMYKTYGEEGFKVFNFQLFPCKNNTNSNGVTCKPQEVIDNYLSSAYLSTYFTDYSINTNNFTNPYTKYFKNEFTAVSSGSFTAFILYFQHYFVNSDNGFFFQEEDAKRIPKFEMSKSSYSAKPNSSGLFLEFSLQLKSNKTTFYRKYIKMQELMAQIGGITNLLLIIVGILNYFPSLTSYKCYLANCFYQIPSNNLYSMNNWFRRRNLFDRFIKCNPTNEAYLTVKNVNKCCETSNTIERREIHVPTINTYLNKETTFNQKLRLGMTNSLFYICIGKKNLAKQIMEKAYTHYQKNFSVESFYNLSLTVTKLKYLLLTGIQNSLIDSLGSPSIISSDLSIPFDNYSNYVQNFSYENLKDNSNLNCTLEENQRKLSQLHLICSTKQS